MKIDKELYIKLYGFMRTYVNVSDKVPTMKPETK